MKPIPFHRVNIQSDFWVGRIKKVREVTVPACLQQCEKTGRLSNFRKSAGREQGEFKGTFFDDSDVYKVLEGAAYCLVDHSDETLENWVDGIIDDICAAQQEDGYIYNYFTLNTPEKRWTDMDMHEAYCLGHMLEAGIAYAQATGKNALLECAVRGVQQMMTVFGPGKRKWVVGHQELELALVRLYRYTGEKKYLDFAVWLIEQRGHGHFDSERQRTTHHFPRQYYQDEKPFEEMDVITGHAVRAMYYFTGVADSVAAEDRPAWRTALERLWHHVYPGNMYVTGGIGQSCDNEGFTHTYHKPCLTAYCETCASIGMAMWNHRMNLLSSDAKYADLVEIELYNGILSGISLSGDRFFYDNPLASIGKHHRVPWYSCSCCPTNLCRFIPSVGGYAYAVDGSTLYVNQFVGGELQLEEEGNKLRMEVTTDYPWDGRVVFSVKECEGFDRLRIRIPGWCKQYALDGAQGNTEGQGYLTVELVPGTAFAYEMQMEPRRVYEDERVRETKGRVCVCRGPIVYCAEEVDQPELLPSEYFHCDLSLASEAELSEGKRIPELQHAQTIRAGELTLIPYAFWDNRKAGAMTVWMKET